jgi:hypothetical protein
MNWDQIETKWAAMTCRVRRDWAVDRPERLSKLPRGSAGPEGKPAVLADRVSGTPETARHETVNE